MKEDRIRLRKLAKLIGEGMQSLERLSNQLYWLEEDLDNQKTLAVPVEGWPGKNEGERKAAADKAFLSNRTIMELIAKKRGLTSSKAEITGILAKYESERRAIEYCIRDTLASVLTGYDDEAILVQNESQIDNLAAAMEEETPPAKEPAPQETTEGGEIEPDLFSLFGTATNTATPVEIAALPAEPAEKKAVFASPPEEPELMGTGETREEQIYPAPTIYEPPAA